MMRACQILTRLLASNVNHRDPMLPIFIPGILVGLATAGAPRPHACFVMVITTTQRARANDGCSIGALIRSAEYLNEGGRVRHLRISCAHELQPSPGLREGSMPIW